MYTIQVNNLYSKLKMMLQDKWGYIINKSGQVWTAKDQAAATDEMAKKYGSQWIGHHVTDCSGVMVYIWKVYGMKIEHSSNAIARKYVGELSTTPKPGYAAFKWRKDGAPARWQDGKGDYYHIGIVGEDGTTVYEAQGTKAGFVTSKASKWKYFAPFKDVEYGENKKEETKPMRVAITTDKVNVRSAAKKTAPRLFYANAGDIGEVIGEENGWYHLNIDGRKGWVFGQFTIPVAENEVVQPNDGPGYVVEIRLTREELADLYEQLKGLLNA